MRKWLLFAIIAIPVTYTPLQVLDLLCKSRCRSPNGYVSGIYVESRCWCADPLDPSKFDDKAIILPKKVVKQKIFVVPYGYED